MRIIWPGFGRSKTLRRGAPMRLRLGSPAAAALALSVAFLLPGQTATPTPSPAPTPTPMLDLRFIRMKISAGDLPSAESILEVHRAEKGEDAEYLLGMAWLARGAALLGDWPSASR